MAHITISELEPGEYYWARHIAAPADDREIVQISNVFGGTRDYWTVAVSGSDQHHSLAEYHFLKKVEAPIDIA